MMNKRSITAAALALVVTPFGVDAEILSQKRLAEILNSQAPGPVDIETIRARDKDLLVSLGVTLREKYGSVLTGSEIVFTRTERAGRIVYRMDFIGVKTQDHARGICQILEVENCVILSDDGNASLISAEVDEDGLLSLDEFVPFSGPVRMQKLPASGPAWVETEGEVKLPAQRPDMAKGDEASEKADAEDGVETDEKIEDQEEADSDKKEETPSNTSDLEPEAAEDASADVVIETPKVAVQYDEPNAEVRAEHVLPMSRPSVITLASMATMDLPMARPGAETLMPSMRMALPLERPVRQFGLDDHLPMPRDAVIRLAESSDVEDLDHSMISDAGSVPMFEQGFEIVQQLSEITDSLAGFSVHDAAQISIAIPGAGTVEMPENLPSISVAVDKRALDAVVQQSDEGLEMEIAGMDGDAAENLPRVFVLSFAEDGVKAFPNARVEPAKESFEIAPVVMTDAFAKPFDVRGDGMPDLQKLPRLRPDLSVFESDIAFVSNMNTNILLDQLLEEPKQVAQAPSMKKEPESHAERLMERLSGMSEEDGIQSDINLEAPSDVEVDSSPAVKKPAPEETSVEPIAPKEDSLPKAQDGLVDLEAMEDKEQSKREALSVLGEIAAMEKEVSEPVTSAPEAPKYHSPKLPKVKAPTSDDRGIFDVAGPDRRADEIKSNPELRIELSYATTREDVGRRAKELEAYIPDVIMEKGRFYGYRMPTAPETYIIGIEARDRKSRDDIIWYLERMQIPWTIRKN